MKALTRFAACLIATLLAGTGFAQAPEDQTDENVPGATTAAPVAHIYVTTPKGIELYDAASNGKLTLVSGSPFEGNVFEPVTNGKYFFATDGTYIYEYSVATSGALKLMSKFNPEKYSPSFEDVGSLDLDHTGATLYCGVWTGNEETYFQTYRISKSNGDLEFLEDNDNGNNGLFPLSFLGNDKFAFTTYVYYTNFLGGYKIDGNGVLAGIPEFVYPTAKLADTSYYPYVATADPTDHLATAVYLEQNPPDGAIVGPTQLAVYTSNSAGDLTTKSTYKNMPAVKVASVSRMNMSPSGKLLAVSGDGYGVDGSPGPAGLQIFHFNGASPVTEYTGLIATTPIENLHWDNANHLYATSNAAGKLYVFTVTPTSVSEAPGSPYNLKGPNGLVVVPIL